MKIDIRKIASLTGHSGSVYTLDSGLTKDTFFSASSDKFIALWNLQRLEPEKFAAQFPSIIYSICHVTEKKLLLVGTSSGSIHILDLESKKEIKILQHHTGPIFDLKYSVTSNCFYSAGGDGNFSICSLESLSVIAIKRLCDEKVRSIDINYSSSEIAVASGDCMIRIFELNNLTEKRKFTAHNLSSNIVKYSPDGKHLLSGGRDAYLKVWNVGDYQLIKEIPAHNFALYDIVFHPEGKLFATASRDKTIKIWESDSFKLLVRINKESYDGHLNSVNKLLWSNYNDYLISTGDDRSIMIWDIQPGRLT